MAKTKTAKTKTARQSTAKNTTKAKKQATWSIKKQWCMEIGGKQWCMQQKWLKGIEFIMLGRKEKWVHNFFGHDFDCGSYLQRLKTKMREAALSSVAACSSEKGEEKSKKKSKKAKKSDLVQIKLDGVSVDFLNSTKNLWMAVSAENLRALRASAQEVASSPAADAAKLLPAAPPPGLVPGKIVWQFGKKAWAALYVDAQGASCSEFFPVADKDDRMHQLRAAVSWWNENDKSEEPRLDLGKYLGASCA